MNLHGILAAISIIVASSGAIAQTQTFQVAGVTRNYILHAPTGLGEKPPLVFVIHGFNMTGQQEVNLTRMNAVADREKFIVVYPNALPNGSNQQSWDMSGSNDFAYLLTIIDSVEAKHKIDRNRVYASGFSQGGFLSFQLACRYADRFAAIAPVSGLLNGACAPKRPVPMIFTFGTNEGFDVNGFIQTGDKWVELNGCTGAPAVARPYPASNPNSVVTRTTHTACKEGAEVVVQSVQGGGHEWPMNTQTKVNNSEEIWAFFKRFTLGAATALPGNPVPALREGLSAFYSEGSVRLRGVGGKASVRVIDYRGKLVATATAEEGRFAFKDKHRGLYQVFVDAEAGPVSARIAVP